MKACYVVPWSVDISRLWLNENNEKINVCLITLGSLKRLLDLEYIKGWSSKLFSINTLKSIEHLEDSDGLNWEYSNDSLKNVLLADKTEGLTIGIIAHPLEGNYYMRRLSNDVAVISLYQMSSIIKSNGFSVENYVMRNIYELVVLYAANGSFLSQDCHTWAHHDIRGCLFDLNSDKENIISSMDMPILCKQCMARLLRCSLDKEFIPILEKELRKIRIDLFSRIVKFVKSQPKLSILIAFVSAVFINLVSSYIYDNFGKLLRLFISKI